MPDWVAQEGAGWYCMLFEMLCVPGSGLLTGSATSSSIPFLVITYGNDAWGADGDFAVCPSHAVRSRPA